MDENTLRADLPQPDKIVRARPRRRPHPVRSGRDSVVLLGPPGHATARKTVVADTSSFVSVLKGPVGLLRRLRVADLEPLLLSLRQLPRLALLRDRQRI